ncbi:MAG: winged helix-turn-helix transcriptional regulator, partial [Candidatus Dadabacteria bacterium]|nr:winged helix-turn-helix transcriptional regulator [Candidatus Dadabacteria bacterium]NIS08792.1 winged helix-turn-helix transcriptional regulator [Candidatus Dadabacteria bacterium]NIV42735.1 helix-turn-helix domain-containing protein [Candidatus Dadabacteria bacterium]NIY22136.1 helix-turn-helix domain-containing protein [Candidatus Dadabacteria bacterium]
EIIEIVSEEPVRITTVAAKFNMSLPAVSKHIKKLERAGLIKRDREGRVHYIKLDSKPLYYASKWLDHYKKFWEQQFDSLDDYLKKIDNRGEK